MKLRRGPRPWPVTVFAGVLLAAASWNLGADLKPALAHPVEAERIAMVSAASARFCILAIPAAAIWLLGSRVARWFVTLAAVGFAAYKIAGTIRFGLADGDGTGRLLAGLALNGLTVLLFTPSASRWFAAGGPRDALARD
ncbi:hypothetical protein [Tsuneonella amylolytica]|uniref:hypothetical protein n=1 Tax=Tsuneonella amylolytica TaxID=2338327 RepID=UPI000EA960DA|nr:hypothetical protein [Tsuneonella amylolytica]